MEIIILDQKAKTVVPLGLLCGYFFFFSFFLKKKNYSFYVTLGFRKKERSYNLWI